MRIIAKDNIAEPFRAPLGEVIYEMIGRPEDLGGTSKHSFVHVSLPPGKSSAAHYHKVSEETYYVLQGTGRLIINNKTFALNIGQACLIMPGEVHQIFNDGETPLEFLTVSAPAWTPDDSFDASSAPA
jgi:mannose-6-phosphate isomerase-like protein (cupin superfamily)